MFALTCDLVPGIFTLYLTRMLLTAVIWRLNIKHTIICALVRCTFKILGPRQVQSILPGTRATYADFVKRTAVANKHTQFAGLAVHEVQQLKTDVPSALLWLGNRKKASKVVLFFHGGGYILPAAPAHIRWPWDSYVAEGKRMGVDVACAVLEYGLAPDVKSPHQLQQALTGLQAILDQGFRPSDVILGGDSAGGNLTMQLLLYLRHKPADIMRLTPVVLPDVKLEEPLLGAFQVSTFVSLDAIMKKKSGPAVDMISLGVARRLIRVNVPTHLEKDLMSGKLSALLPLDADPAYFDDLDQTVSNMYISYGEYELIADHSIKLIQKIKSRCKGVNVVVRKEPKGAHDVIIMEYFLPGAKGGPASRDMKKWVRSLWK